MGDRTAFFYGTLMVPAVLHRVCNGTPYPSQAASPLSFTHAILHKHSRHKVRSCDYPAVIPSSNHSASVRGSYVRGLTDRDIWQLDIYEGDQYVRKMVKIRILAQVGDDAGIGSLEAEEDVQTETYLWIAGEDALEESEWDFAEFKRDKLRSWLMLDDHFADVDAAAKAREINNNPTGEKGVNGDITKIA